MIQRIQSIYLLLQIALLALMFFVPFQEFFTKEAENVVFYHNGVQIASSGEILIKTSSITILISVLIVLTIVTVFLYKKRTLQMRFCNYTVILSLGSFILFIYYNYLFKNTFQLEMSNYKVYILTPLVIAFLGYQAFRGIRKDELLVKSYDRLR